MYNIKHRDKTCLAQWESLNEDGNILFYVWNKMCVTILVPNGHPAITFLIVMLLQLELPISKFGHLF